MTNYITKYELARLLGVRAEQIASGSPSTVDVPPELLGDAGRIARLELKLGKVPIDIRRPYPDGTLKTVRVSKEDRHGEYRVFPVTSA